VDAVADPTTSAPGGDDGPESDEGLAASRPPATFAVVRTWVIQTVRELSDLRAEILAEIGPQSGDAVQDLGSIAHHMVLVASELATNALRHGIPPTIVHLMRDDDLYLLDVADHDLSSTPYVAGSRPPGQGGFGLQIARRLALDVGWYATPTTKHVWARFPVPA
jgi:serine/threonine-protein kinase RsbW